VRLCVSGAGCQLSAPPHRNDPLRAYGIVLALVGLARVAHAQSAADSAAIRATALDYIDGWYTNDGPRMERALHTHLAKRLVYQDSSGHSHLVDLTALELVQGTKAHPPVAPADRREDIAILSIFGNATVVRIDASTWVDFLQEIKWNGRWEIINVVWENRPKPSR
jgi:Putative lumazine-binding